MEARCCGRARRKQATFRGQFYGGCNFKTIPQTFAKSKQNIAVSPLPKPLGFYDEQQGLLLFRVVWFSPCRAVRVWVALAVRGGRGMP